VGDGAVNKGEMLEGGVLMNNVRNRRNDGQ
jgi:hypothetical protein